MLLLEEAKSLMPKILLPKFDILIIDQIGKNFLRRRRGPERIRLVLHAVSLPAAPSSSAT